MPVVPPTHSSLTTSKYSTLKQSVIVFNQKQLRIFRTVHALGPTYLTQLYVVFFLSKTKDYLLRTTSINCKVNKFR